MTVIYHEPQSWFFLKNNIDYFIDVNCNYSAFGFSLLIQLNETEINDYNENGQKFLANFANDIQYHALTKYMSRQIKGEVEKSVYDAIQLFNKNYH
ncbi:MAG: hypothetical protein ACK50A_04970 [Sphingobacteriaceae bacterium]|jgi:hypothetical protein